MSRRRRTRIAQRPQIRLDNRGTIRAGPGGGNDVLVLLANEGEEFSLTLRLLGLLSVPALVVLNGFFVAAEFALVAVRKTRVEEMVSAGRPRAPRPSQDAVDHLDRTIAATQLGITLASIALGWVGEPALARLLEPLLRRPARAVARPSPRTPLAVGARLRPDHLPARRLRRADPQDAGPADARPHRPVGRPAR